MAAESGIQALLFAAAATEALDSADGGGHPAAAPPQPQEKAKRGRPFKQRGRKKNKGFEKNKRGKHRSVAPAVIQVAAAVVHVAPVVVQATPTRLQGPTLVKLHKNVRGTNSRWENGRVPTYLSKLVTVRPEVLPWRAMGRRNPNSRFFFQLNITQSVLGIKRSPFSSRKYWYASSILCNLRLFEQLWKISVFFLEH